ncbi:MAG: Translation factor guf1 mitochondrial [Chaenotheca gracillima]|nr:MAG: Translation factor guf1 mitochondrial [Chaenotheca gracillima]
MVTFLEETRIHYTAVQGFFMQDDLATDPTSFDYAANNFGLISRSYPGEEKEDDQSHKRTQWQRFERYVSFLNADAEPNVQYKVLFLGRHGQGFHNVAEKKYGTKAWDDYWSRLDGDGAIVWADAHLTPTGEEQARAVNRFWKKQIDVEKIPMPETYYVSPLTRCLNTARLSFDGLDFPKRRPFIPTVKELAREVIGIHTCDRRSSKSYIHEKFPDYLIEKGFTEEDELWRSDFREAKSDLNARLGTLLNDIFRTDPSTFISITSHSGAIAAVMRGKF